MKRPITYLLALCVIVSLFLTPALAADDSSEGLIYRYLTGEMGLNSAAASGVLANLYYESGLNPDVWGDSGTSYGLCQWHNDRCTRLFAYCAENGLDADSLEGQLAYLAWELENCYPGVLSYIQQVSDDADGAYAAADYWCRYFEVPANVDTVAAQRGAAALDYYGTYSEYETYENDAEDSDTDGSESSRPPRYRHSHRAAAE